MIWDIDDILMACNNGRFLWDMNGIVWDRYTNGVPRQDDRLWSWILKMVMIFNGIYPLGKHTKLLNITTFNTSINYNWAIFHSYVTRGYICIIYAIIIHIYIYMYVWDASNKNGNVMRIHVICQLCDFLVYPTHSFHVLIQFWIIHNEMDNHDSRFESWCCDKPVVFISC